jgi:hypothetical protein
VEKLGPAVYHLGNDQRAAQFLARTELLRHSWQRKQS